MKDKLPFNLRSHKLLFGRINTVYRSRPAHEPDALGLCSPGRASARAAIEYFRGTHSDETKANLRDALKLFQELVGMRDPLVFLRLAALCNLALTEDLLARRIRWRELASTAVEILQREVRLGVEPLDHAIEVPFYYLETGSDAAIDELIRTLERYRTAGLTYWLAAVPPLLFSRSHKIQLLLKEEEVLLRELRGARFIRLLPYLPMHYRRYGVEFDEAREQERPEGGEREEGHLLPFDQELAIRELLQSWTRLEELWERMTAVAPRYAAQREDPVADIDEFVKAPRPHRIQWTGSGRTRSRKATGVTGRRGKKLSG